MANIGSLCKFTVQLLESNEVYLDYVRFEQLLLKKIREILIRDL